MIDHRRTLAILAAATMLLYVGGGHSSGTMAPHHEDMAGAEAGVCLVLVALLVVASVPRRPSQRTLHFSTETFVLGLSDDGRDPDGRSRASPSRLQRFRN